MEQNSKIQNKDVQTYAGDIAEAVRSGTGGLIKEIIHGEEKNQKEEQKLSPERKKNNLFLSFGIIFIFLASALLYYFISNKDISTVEVAQQFAPLIFNDKTDFIEVANFNKDKIAQNVRNEINTSMVKIGGIEGIYLSENKKVIGLRRFIELIKGSLVMGDTNLVKDYFLMGFINDAGKDFFIILKVRSVTDIFDALRAWENKMFFDLHGLFGMDITPDTNYLLTKNFEDGIIENKNARILYEKDGKIIMMYIFADDNSVVITNTRDAMHELMLRLAGSQIK